MPGEVGLCELVRTSCRRALDNGDHVTLNKNGLEHLARGAVSALRTRTLETVSFDEDRALRSLAGNAINFGSGYHDVVRKEPGMSGAQTMFARLTRYLDATGPLNIDRLLLFTTEDCSQIFGQEMDGGALEQLMSRFAIALNDLGTFLAERGGTAESLLEGCGDSAEALAENLIAMPFYADTEQHGDQTVAFYKRAQITPADLARERLWRFYDLDRLTAFADNLVPHVLRLDGAIDVDPDVVSSIESGAQLEPGSAAEIELRAAAVVAVDELVVLIDSPKVWAMHVDEWLWTKGGSPKYKAVRRPRSRSVFY
jgi:hypothetical protein